MSTPAPYRLGSLCSGYGGLEMALRLAGWPVELAFVADPDPAAAKVLAHHHPDVPNLGDITTVDWAGLERVDILTAGFPCQDISCAGKRAGLAAGTRSGIWANVAEAIATLQPRLVLLENVAALLSTKANRSTDAAASDDGVEPGPAGVGDGTDQPVLRALGAVLGDLADLGFDAVWTCLPAASVGAPHLRKRVFILAWPAADPPRFGHRDTRTAGVGGMPAAAVRGGTGACELSLLPTPNASRVANRVDTQLSGDGRDQPNKLGWAVSSLLPTPRATDGTKGGPNQRGSSGDLMLPSAVMQLLPTPTATPYGNNQSPSVGAAIRPSLDGLVRDADRWGEYAPAIARWEQVIGRPAPNPTEPGTKGQPRLAARFVEWMQGLPDGHVTDLVNAHDPRLKLSRNDALKVLGNGVVPLQGAAAVNHLAVVVAAVTTEEAAA